jgi:hypothetical protein
LIGKQARDSPILRSYDGWGNDDTVLRHERLKPDLTC